MRRHIPAFLMSLRLVVALGLVVCVAYPAAIYAIGQVFFDHQAEGSLVVREGKIVGSELLAQPFTYPGYFWPRPSAAGSGYTGTGYDATASGGSNAGPLADRLLAECLPVQKTDKNGNPVVDAKGNPVYETNLDGSKVCNPNTVPQRVMAYRQANGLGPHARVPVDAVTASFSGLDPDISVANARIQAGRVARARGVSRREVLRLVDEHTSRRALGVIGEDTVNVLELNLALDAMSR
jgi:K+-transporting ATPase ATPase C chain